MSNDLVDKFIEIRNENSKYSIEVLELKAKLDCAVKTLEYYADERNWNSIDDLYPYSRKNIIRGDLDTLMPFCAGRRARIALKEINKSN